MSLALTVSDYWDDGKRLHVVGTLTASSNYTTGGDSLDLQALASATVPGCKSQPSWVKIVGQAGYIYSYDSTNKKMLVHLSAALSLTGNSQTIAIAPLSELTGAPTAYPSGVTGDTIKVYAIFKKYV